MKSLYKQIMRGVNQVAPSIFKDPNMTVNLTWKVFLKAEFDREQRKNIEKYQIYNNIVAVKLQKKIDSMNTRNLPSGVGGLVTAETTFLLEMKTIPADVSFRDLIIEDGVTYGVEKIHKVMKRFVLVDIRGIDK